jgi:hypothetical protein
MQNLALLTETERNVIEYDKQAAYWVWKVAHGQLTLDSLSEFANAIRDETCRSNFLASVKKYQRK